MSEPHPLHVLINIAENLNTILSFLKVIPHQQVEAIIAKIGELVEI